MEVRASHTGYVGRRHGFEVLQVGAIRLPRMLYFELTQQSGLATDPFGAHQKPRAHLTPHFG